ncbi:MAG TPA: DNA-directed RNA polymerase subunit delta [Syntrophothermus lipocalidus]|uniref:RNAP delta factor n=1 Tax=Syntrophothermus lipocalidus (strain DSM 12680 / TGB-C1) TaxID=643648 RepID=D7CK73_SYNLT|nr:MULTISPECIES: DNA-directed RNA polymerase subunit delta [Syntrophothermus]ADI03057.1 conserved hypothetical protein [Syntrophothermus lipocalidus DSM 12680]NSW82103.1 DNA-directed RNA polymerase subunit delta [Syntrophothermus sp.]HHV76249.1 DNA-directed RNA polymerase subunit delta [Syntrophothermus lipocalidus]HOV42468.1 DNA-directed RNA polymerase subunit delta [Syntrophothermus lipocalidus]
MTAKKSEADWAYEVLRNREGPVYYRELVETVLQFMNREINPRNMAAVYTQINLDNRFGYMGDGYWALKVR